MRIYLTSTFHLLFVCMFCLLLNLVCGSNSPSNDSSALQRRLAFREKIKLELGAKYFQPVASVADSQNERGAEIYSKLCAPCHGGRGKGDGFTAEGLLVPPSDFTDAKQAAFYSEPARVYIIRNGVPGTPMIGWDRILPEDDILAVYAFVRSLITSKQ
ncbi:MAG: c-type cytochrome [bacterium]